MGTTAEPMQTDTAAAGPSTSKKKGDPLVEKKDAPWVEKYRPKTLDDVAAHKEIIDTSRFACKPLAGPVAGQQGLNFAQELLCRLQSRLQQADMSTSKIRLFVSTSHCSQEAHKPGPPPTLAAVWAPWHWQDVHHTGCSPPDLRQFHAEHDAGAECI